MTAATERQQRNLLAKDMEKGRLYLAPLKTAAELTEWQRRRDRYRTAICRWAARRAQADRYGFNAGREAVRMVRKLGLTAADDEQIRSRVPTGPTTGRWAKGART